MKHSEHITNKYEWHIGKYGGILSKKLISG